MTSLVTWLKQETRRRILPADTNKQSFDPEMQRYAEFGRIGAGLLHDLSTPLTAATITLSNLQAEQSSRQLKRALADLKRIERYIKSARQQLGNEAPRRLFSLNPLIKQACRTLEVYADLKATEIITELEPNIRLRGDLVKLQRVITNLVVNAIESYDELSIANKQVMIKTEKKYNHVFVSIIDFGKGIKKSDLGLVFEPFYTTKQAGGRSLGIGLALVKSTIENDFGGSVHIKSQYMRGTKFIISIPLVRKS